MCIYKELIKDAFSQRLGPITKTKGNRGVRAEDGVAKKGAFDDSAF